MRTWYSLIVIIAISVSSALASWSGMFQDQIISYDDNLLGWYTRMAVDSEGTIHVVWNEKVDELEKVLKKDVELQIVNAKVKKRGSESLEIHFDTATYVEILAPTEELLEIADLKEGLNHVNVEGEIVTKPMRRDVKTSNGELVKLTVFELKDETGRIWVSAWRIHAEPTSNLKVGDKVIIKKAYLRKGFGNKLELSTRHATSIIFPKQMAKESEEQL